MSKAIISSRKEQVETFLTRIHNDQSTVKEIREDQQSPKRFLVGEYESGDLLYFWTVDTLDEAENDINNHEAGSPREFTVFDLDTPGKEHRVIMLAQVQR